MIRPDRPRPTRTALLALATLAWLPYTGSAQEASPDTTEAIRLPGLDVTVLRDLTPRTSVPYAVSGLDGGELHRAKTGAFLEEALAGLPGVQVQNRYNYAVGERLAIRGFGSRSQFGIRGVKVLVDGVPATMPDGQSTLDHVDLTALDRAEVLRGPGSALYGNAAGGVLVLRTGAPTPGPVEPEARVVVGSDGLVNARGGVEGWIGPVGLSVRAGALRWDGFRDNPFAGAEDAREDLDTDARYGHADREQLHVRAVTAVAGGTLRLTVSTATMDAENPGSLPADSLDAGVTAAWGGNVVQATRESIEHAQAGAAWDGAVPGGRLEAAGWVLGRSVSGRIPPAVLGVERRAGGARALFQRERGGAFTWGLGAEVELMRDDRTNNENDGGRAGALTLDQRERVRNLGGFVRAELRIGPARLSAAVRYDQFRFEARDRFVALVPGPGYEPDDSGERDMDGWSPSAGLVFDADDDLELWANVATSLETPTTTELVNRPDGAGGFNESLEPQRSLGFEVGARGRLGPRVRWELVGFRTETEDELVPFESEAQEGRTFFRNAGESEHDGVEATVEVAPGAGLRGRLTFTHTDARFVAYQVDTVSYAGNRVPGLAPNRLQATLGGERGRLFWTVDAEWSDEVPVDDAGGASAEAYWLVGARAGLERIDLGDGVRVSPFAGVTNLLDEAYVASVTVNAFGGRYFEPGPGRSFYVGVSARWDRR